MGLRRRGRELAFQLLFQMDLKDCSMDVAAKGFTDLAQAKEDARAFALELASGAAKVLPDLDAQLAGLSKKWDLSRISSVDKALLRLGAFELGHRPDIPPEVTLNECIELAKIYGMDESPAFINGLLDQLRRDLLAAAPPKKKKKAAAKKKL